MNSKIALGIVLCQAAFAQSVLDKEPQKGVLPTASYSVSDIETINNANGDVLLRIPIATLPPGRGGLTAGLSLVYNSKSWDASATINDNGNFCQSSYTTYALNASETGGWHYAYRYEVRVTKRADHYAGSCKPQCPSAEAYHNWRFELVFPDGSVHGLIPRGYEAENTGGYFNVREEGTKMVCGLTGDAVPSTIQPNPANLSLYTTDGTYVRVDVTAGNADSWTIAFRDGRRVINRPSDGQYLYGPNGNDTNHDYVVIRGTTLTDAFNRSITLTTNSGSPDTVVMQGVNAALQWNIAWSTITIPHTYTPYDTPPQSPPLPQQLPTLFEVTSIGLPTQLGSLAYTFDYGPAASRWGPLRSVTLPAGATAAYSFDSDSLFSAPVSYQQVLDDTVRRKDLTYSTPEEGSVLETWSYNLGNSGATIQGPDGGTFSELRTNGLVYKTTTPDGSIVENVWRENRVGDAVQPIIDTTPNSSDSVRPLANPFIAATYSSIANLSRVPAATGITLFSADKNGNATGAAEYGFVPYVNQARDGTAGAAPWLRTTANAYYTAAFPPANGQDICHNGFYCDPASPQVVQAIQSQRVTGPVTGPQNASATEYCYDNAGQGANLTMEARWDSTLGGTVNSAVANCGATPAPTATAVATIHTYDSVYKNRTSTKDPNGNVTAFTYGSVGGFSDLYPTQTVTASGTGVQQSTMRTYDLASGAVKSVTDPNTVLTRTDTLDDFGRPTLVTRAVGTTRQARTSYTYGDAGRYVITRSDLNGADLSLTAVQRFDPLGRLRLRQQLETSADIAALSNNPLSEGVGIQTQLRYRYGTGASYRLTSNPYRNIADTTLGWTRSKIDQVGREVETETFSGAIPAGWTTSSASSMGKTAVAYDAGGSGRLISTTDAAGVSRMNGQDALGRLVQVTEGCSGCVSTYAYDVLDNLGTVTQGTQTRSFAFSSLKRLTSATNPESGTTTYSYYANGDLHTRTDGRMITATMNYDGQNRVTYKSYSDGSPSVSYTYDTDQAIAGHAETNYPVGRLVAMSNFSAVSTYRYDAAGQAQSSRQTTGGTNYVFGYGYNMAGSMTSETYPSGRVVSTGYDAANRAVSVGSGASTYASGVSYAPHGSISQMALGNGIAEVTEFNSKLQMFHRGSSLGAGQKLNLYWFYCPGANTMGAPNPVCASNNGNVLQHLYTSEAQALTTQTFGYDAVNRLSAASESGGWSQGYNYDQWGNRAVGSGGYIPNPAFTATVLSEFTGNRWNGSGVSAATYDGAGNQKLAGNGSRNFGYDAESRMVTATEPNTGAITYGYDGDGRRVTKTVGGATTAYVYDAAGQLAAEYGTATGFGTQYLLTDALGSTRMVTDGAGVVRNCYDYLPFGEDLAAGVGGRGSCYGSGNYPGMADVESLKFTSKERDAETGLDWFERRYFSGAQGRFTSPDPLGGHIEDPQSLNRYVYARNNPLRYTDSTGLDFYLDCKDKSDTCQGGRVGTTDDKGKFTATLISNDKNGGLVDQNGNQFTGSFDQHGISFTDSNGNDYSGRFAANTAATTLSGSGIFAGFTGVFNSNGLNTNIAQGSLFGSPQAFQALLTKLVGPNVGLDALNGFHPGSIQYRGGNDNGPDPHLSFDSNHQPGANGLLFQPFHYDGAFPFGDVSGFVEHTSSVLKSLFETKVLRQKDVPPPVSIPH